MLSLSGSRRRVLSIRIVDAVLVGEIDSNSHIVTLFKIQIPEREHLNSLAWVGDTLLGWMWARCLD